MSFTTRSNTIETRLANILTIWTTKLQTSNCGLTSKWRTFKSRVGDSASDDEAARSVNLHKIMEIIVVEIILAEIIVVEVKAAAAPF